ncbi:MAG: hypothetical protein LBI87_13225 [Candidatus Accumulibacter sp.]|jgi:hypothetical protein|nr:hypothetical protein [Accumulibacter sp.]
MNSPRRRFSQGPRRAWPLCAFLLAASFPAPAQELGRLFFTPERREALDRQRRAKLPERKEVPRDPALSIDGVVTRSSGKRTVWINGVAQDERRPGGGVAVIPSRAHPGQVIVLPEGGPDAQASVGDTVDRNTGETADRLGGGKILVKPVPSR